MTRRCSFCDIAHDETAGRCPTDLEYERGYRTGAKEYLSMLCEARTALADAVEHEQQTHEQLGAILGTDTSLVDAAQRLIEQLAACRALLREACVNDLWAAASSRTDLAYRTLALHRAQWKEAARAAGGGGDE